MITGLLTTVGLLIVFLVTCFFFVYLPGFFVINHNRSTLSNIEILFLSLVTGLAIITLQGVVFGLLQIRFLGLFTLILVSSISTYLYRSEIFRPLESLLKNRALLVLLVFGLILQGFINFPSGFHYSNGINFWSSQGHDGLWHISLMEEIKTNFPPSIPLYAGHSLSNYHYLSDVFMGEFYRLFPFFSALDLYFRFYPILFSLLIGLSTYCLVYCRFGDQSAKMAVYITQCCGSLGFIYSILKRGPFFSGETTFWASQGNSILGNPPHTVGIIIITTLFYLILLWEKEKQLLYLFLLIILGSVLTTIKVSVGVIFAASFVTYGTYRFVRFGKIYPIFIALLLGISNYLSLKIISPTAQSFLNFEPLWFPRTMMVAKLDNVEWELRRQHYQSLHILKANVHLMFHEAYAVFIFILGNFGLRTVGLVSVIAQFFTKVDSFIVLILASTTLPIFIILLFTQKGITFNLIQFIQIGLHFSGIFSAIVFVYVLEKIKSSMLKLALIGLILFFSLPTSIGNLFDFYGRGNQPLAIISDNEILALTWLKQKTPLGSIILTKPFNKNAHYEYKNPPIPIGAWYPTSYIHALSGRRTVLTGEEQLQIMGYDIEADLNLLRRIFSINEISADWYFEPGYKGNKTELLSRINLDRNRLISKVKYDYLYLSKRDIQTMPPLQIDNIIIVYENPEVVIYKHV